MIIYISGPYSADTEESIQENIRKASEVALQAWEKGWTVICPHMNTSGFHNHDSLTYEHVELVMIEINEIYCGDCLDYMKEMPDNCVDLVLTDPPYGLGNKLSIGGCKTPNRMQELYNISNWVDVAPDQKYFDEIFRISKNQIICGGNYFDLPPTRGFIVWDKIKHASNYSQAEYLWTSFDMVSKIFRFCSNGGFVINKQNAKLHPTQKPIELIEFCIKLCSEEGQTIFDPFLGSGTTAVACINTGRNFIGIEKDLDYFRIAEERIRNAKEQTRGDQWW